MTQFLRETDGQINFWVGIAHSIFAAVLVPAGQVTFHQGQIVQKVLNNLMQK